jgi:hypothetical protein
MFERSRVAGQVDDDGVVVRRLDALHGREGVGDALLDRDLALDVELHGGGVQGGAVGEADARPQVEDQGVLGVVELVALGEPRLDVDRRALELQ